MHFKATAKILEAFITNHAESPFIRRDGKLYLRYDEVLIESLGSLKVNFCLKGEVLCYLNVSSCSLEPPGSSLSLKGITGEIELVEFE